MGTLLHVVTGNLVGATVLALVAAGVGRVCRRPALTHSLWVLVLLKLVTPSVLPVRVAWPVPESVVTQQTPRPVVIRPDLPAPVLPAVEPEPAASLAAPVEPEEPAPRPALEPPAKASRERQRPEERQPPSPPAPMPISTPRADVPAVAWPDVRLVIVGLWLTGSLFWLLLAGRRVARFRRLLPHARPAPRDIQHEAERLAEQLGLSRCPRVWLVAGAVSPMVWSLVGPPRLLLPAGLLQRLSAEQRATLLVHELAHLRRRDHWVRGLELLVMALYWWFPLVWWARRELREAEEECCDAWVVWALPDSARAYALAIVATLDFLSGACSAMPVAASGMGPVHPLRRRLTMIMRASTPRALSVAGVLAVLGLGALALPWLPVQAQDRAEKLGREAQDDRRPAQDDLDRARKEIEDLHQHMRQLAERMEATQQRLREAERRLGERAGRDPRRVERRPDGQQPPGAGRPGAGLQGPGGPGGPMMPPGGGPPGMNGPGMGGPPGMPGGMMGRQPGGDIERRLQNIEWKLDALLKQMEDLRNERRPQGGQPGGGNRFRGRTPPGTPPVPPPPAPSSPAPPPPAR